jgi:hypothetical protein
MCAWAELAKYNVHMQKETAECDMIKVKPKKQLIFTKSYTTIRF